MIPKPFDAISKADIDALVVAGTRESREIEYKGTLPALDDNAKREFLYDVSSFANATGGDLLFGVDAIDGVATSTPGVPIANPDAETLRLESMIRDGVDPRLTVRTKIISGFSGGAVVLLRIQKSWQSPHMVTFKNAARFFTRNSAGKHQMDVSELRSAFLLSEGAIDKLRRFRDKRLSMIISGDTPLSPASFIACHLLPLTSGEIKFPFDGADHASVFPPLGFGFGSSRYNIDGYFVRYDNNRGQCQAYCQLFRNGALETVNSIINSLDSTKLFASRLERDISQALGQYLPGLERLGVPFPMALTCFISGVKGRKVYTGNEIMEFDPPVIDRDQIDLPDVLIENAKVALNDVLKPLFDSMWQAGGYPHSFTKTQ